MKENVSNKTTILVGAASLKHQQGWYTEVFLAAKLKEELW